MWKRSVNSKVLWHNHCHHHRVHKVEPGETPHKQDTQHFSTDHVVQSLSPLACAGDAEK